MVPAKRTQCVRRSTQCTASSHYAHPDLRVEPIKQQAKGNHVALSQQMSLRVSEDHRRILREKLEELRARSQEPEKVTEADAARAIIEEAAAARKAEVRA